MKTQKFLLVAETVSGNERKVIDSRPTREEARKARDELYIKRTLEPGWVVEIVEVD